MTGRWASFAVPPLVAAVVAAVLLGETLGGAGLGTLVGVVVLVAAGVVFAALRGLDAVAAVLLVVAVGAATWNGLAVGGLQIAHMALAAAGLVLAVVTLRHRRAIAVPVWACVLPAAIVVVACAAEVWPTAASYVESRVEVPVPAPVAVTLPSWQEANVLGAVSWLAAAAVLPLVMCLALPSRPRLAGRLADVWALGAAVSAAVAITDELGVTRISAGLLPLIDIGGRQAGLSAQPNHLAVAVAVVTPIVTWRVLSSGTVARRASWLGVGIVLAGGLLTSGSRGGLVGAAAGVLVMLAVLPAGRRLFVPLLGLGVGAAALTVAVAPSAATQLAVALRLSDAATAQESNAIRSGIADQALVDFGHSPLRGLGLSVVTDGHSIYLQLLASGGLLLGIAFAVAMAGCALDATALARRVGDLPRVLLAATGVWLLVGIVENQLTDVYLYVPFALVAGLCALPAPAVPPAPPTAHTAVPLLGGNA